MFLVNLYRVIAYALASKVRRLRVECMSVAELHFTMNSTERLSTMTVDELNQLGRSIQGLAFLTTLPSVASTAPDAVELPDGTRIPWDEVPKDASGNISAAWLDVNCDCGGTHGATYAPIPVTPDSEGDHTRPGMYL